MLTLSWWRRLKLFLFRDRATRELEEEMRLHRALRAEQLARSGIATAEADALAERRFGNATQVEEASRDAWGLAALEALQQDLRYAARRLRQQPGFTAAVVIVLALGIGATTAMFSAVDAAILRPLPFLHADRLQILPNVNIPFDPGPGQQFPKSDAHIPDINDLNAMPQVFSSAAGYAVGGLNLGDAERPTRLTIAAVTTNFFPTLGIGSAIGRTFVAPEGKPGQSYVAILSWGLWQRQFGGREMIGRSIILNTKPYVIVGVMPQGFSFPQQSDLWIPLTLPTTFESFEAFRNFLPSSVIARLAAGVSPVVASHQLVARWRQGLAPGLQREADGQGWIHQTLHDVEKTGGMIPLQRGLVGDRRAPLMLLLSATGLLLLIACANVANLLLSQGASRRREVAVREVLGATRVRIVRQLLTESVLLAMLGTAIGVAAAPLALRVISSLMPHDLAGVAPIGLNLRVLVFAATLALVTGVALGLWPALGASRGDLGATVKSGGGHGSTWAALGMSRRLLVGAELALAVMLLIGAGLMLRSFAHLLDTDSGMQIEHAGTLQLTLPSSMPWGRKRVEINAILDRLRASPGIVAAGAVNDLPLSGSGGITLQVTADGVPPHDNDPGARDLIASPGLFAALGIRMLAGRDIAATDDSGGASVAVISASMARHYWPGQSALGKVFRTDPTRPTTVIGVVADTRELKLDAEPYPEMYVPMAQYTPPNVAIVARGILSSSALLEAIRSAVRAVDPAQAVYNVRTMDDVVGKSLAPRRTNTLLLTIFAALAFVLAAVGVAAVVGYGVTQRRRELGIRSALGASGADLIALLSREMALVALLGIAVGLAGAWALARVTSSLVYGVAIHDTVTFVAAPLLLLVAAMIATAVPARRALRVDPAAVMRND